MTNDPDDDLPPLPEDVGVHVLIQRMDRLEHALTASADQIRHTGDAIGRNVAGIDQRSAHLERQVHRFAVHSLWSFGGGIFLAMLALLTIGGFVGRQWGRQEGYDDASTENAAASWGATDEGRWAYAFAQSGELAMIRHCSGQGWEVRKGTCSPQTASDHMIYGWHLIDRPALPVRRKHRKTP